MNHQATPPRGGKYPTTHSHHSDPHHTQTQAPEFQHRVRCALECSLWILAACTACGLFLIFAVWWGGLAGLCRGGPDMARSRRYPCSTQPGGQLGGPGG
ncbi:hypothetical protein FMEAI12_6500001 [Parafrankia sp. Ea1.12]|nr:hypothetical protein FMEAI12_6500001 [Parafrankia sp. Ea1.12]